MSIYHFGVPKVAVWSSHILMGLYFIYLGFQLLDIRRLDGVVLLVIGALASLYHSHIWYYHVTEHDKN